MKRRRLLFHRDYAHYTGGHGKVLDYIAHADAHPAWEAHVFVHPRSARQGNPFLAHPRCRIGGLAPTGDDVLFLAGEDWTAWEDPDDSSRPVVNLIQGVRHAAPATRLRGFLSRKATRICVSDAVAEAIRSTGEVNGPVHVIPAALSLPESAGRASLSDEIFIYAHKQPALGAAVMSALQERGLVAQLQTELVPRAEFLQRLEAARIAIVLPFAEEGFFLPALEAMALGCVVVTADCKGNRAYLEDEVNALAPALQLEPIMLAVDRLIADDGLRRRLVDAGMETASRFTLQGERSAFHRILDELARA